MGAGNPINAGYGNKYQEEVDYLGPGSAPLRLVRMYNSKGVIPGAAIGARWRTNFDRGLLLTSATPTASVDMFRPDGKTLTYRLLKAGVAVSLTPYDSGAVWTPDADIADRLTRMVDASGNTLGWTYYVATTEETETYDSQGRLASIASRTGLTQTMTYDAKGRLTAVTDSFGRQLQFGYDVYNRIQSMQDPAGGMYQYSYGGDPQNIHGNDNLTSVTYPDLKLRRYAYNEHPYTQNADLTDALTGITDELGQRFATYNYDTTGDAISTEHAGGVNKYTVSHDYTTSSSVITDPLGTQRTYSFANVLGVIKSTGISQPCPSCGGGSVSATTYDGNGNVASRTDFNGKKVCYAYDLARNLETARVEGLLSSESCGTALASPPNRPDVRLVSTTWNSTYRLPATITGPAPGGTRTTVFSYDGYGNVVQKTVTGPKNDGSGGSTSRTWTWTYTTFGRVATATDPNLNVTTYTYYDNDPDLTKNGNVATISNPLGQVTQITSYDAHSRPLTITDPNGMVTSLTYDPRGRLTSRTVGGETTRYDYDAVGQLTVVTLPNGSTLAYTYDAAHRLTQITDGLGNHIVYTLDAMGNRTGEDVYDHLGALDRTRSRTFDALNRLASDIGAQLQTTDYGYDGNGNLLTSTDPLTHQTGNAYDALNRLLQVTDPATGITGYAYDAAGNLAQVTDPRTLTTVYTYDGLGNLIRQVSPDTGTTNQSFDAAGNLATKVDGGGVAASYMYDVLNRVKQIAYTKSGSPSETHGYEYDGGQAGAPNAKGRLTKLTDPAAITTWTYTAQGRVASKTQQVGTLTQGVAYGYNAAGQRTSLTTPSGQVLGYSYLNNRIAGITVNGAPLVSYVITTPFGPVGAWQWSNGLYTFRDYDADGRLQDWEFRNGVSVLRNDLTWDTANRITAITDPANATLKGGYQYDALDRLTVAQQGNPVTGTQQFGYDAVGNRQNITIDGTLTNLAYGATSNQLTTLSGAIAPDPLHGDLSRSYTYNLANRLVQVQNDVVTLATIQINALGQRVAKTAGGVVTRFVYDEEGHLLGEYDTNGKLIQETVWLDDLPVATLRPTLGSVTNPVQVDVYYVHADHLGSPRAVTRPTDNAIMWRWDNVDPFGANAANENPTGQGQFNYNLRFPGQYYDAETGTNYNYMRDYDATIGRYLQSDPIGLKGGISSYAYVTSSPLANADPTGLVKWHGTRKITASIFTFNDTYQLESDCACGRKAWVTVEAYGVTVPAAASHYDSAVTFEDNFLCVSPYVFEGPYIRFSAGAGIPFIGGSQIGFTYSGGASSPPGAAATSGQVRPGGSIAVGSASVTLDRTEDCGCK